MDRPHLSPDEFVKQPFDFLIVGGGTAGLVVASRLSEHPHLVVGVLEAGSLVVGNREVDCPGLAGHALGGSLDWGFNTAPQPALDGRTFPYARGKVLGGSNVLNYMTWNRAAMENYDGWRDLGNARWGWDDLLYVALPHPPVP
jgi:choline dehydrogenase-like flavoprotein